MFLYVLQARCYEMGRICHPITVMFYGRDDFEKFDRDYYSNNKLLFGKGYRVWVDGVAPTTYMIVGVPQRKRLKLNY